MRLLILLVVATQFLTIDAQQQPCGKLSESYLYNKKKLTALDEYPWLGLLFETQPDGTLRPLCVTVLIAQRYTLIPAHCVASDLVSSRIIFGDWEFNDHIYRGDCNSTNCAPPPQVFLIQEVLEHPNPTATIQDDIALLKLASDVVFTDYIQPICLPPAKEAEDGHLIQRLELAGYPWSGHNIRSKTHAHTTSRNYCIEQYRQTLHSNNYICAYIFGETNLLSGSVLMGVNVTDGKATNFYVIAMTSLGKRKNNEPDIDSPVIFTRIWSYRDLILANIN